MHRYQDLIQLFDQTFFSTFNTRLVRGDEEPFYQPANNEVPWHQLIFAHGYYSSALHEIAHWCIAGEKRRLLPDFGYWYEPDGRTAKQQIAFEQVEVKPQAIEWAFCMAANKLFYVSVDNLNGEQTDETDFKKAVVYQVISYCHQGFPTRAQQFIDALSSFYQRNNKLSIADFTYGKSEAISINQHELIQYDV